MGFEDGIRPLQPQLSFHLNHVPSSKLLVMSSFGVGVDQIDNGNGCLVLAG